MIRGLQMIRGFKFSDIWELQMFRGFRIIRGLQMIRDFRYSGVSDI